MKKIIIDLIKKNNFLLNIISLIYSFPSLLFNIKGKRKNNIKTKGAFLKNTRVKINGKNNSVIIAPENRLNNCLLFIKGDNCKIKIKKHCILHNLELWIEDDAGEIIIDEFTTVEGGHFATTESQKISIGKDCMFSHNIQIRTGDSHPIFDKKSGKRINWAKDIQIKDHVWLGADVKVLKGVTVEKNAIVGTGSIVTGDIDSNSIYVGIPAKKVKQDINWGRFR